MKKIISIIMAVAMLAVCLCGCGNPATTAEANKSGIKIITTIFPEYDWVKSILGDNPGNADVIMLLDSGIDLHNYQPSAEDILNVSTCDLFVYVGGESDEWVDDVLQSAQNHNLVAVNLLEVLGDAVKEEKMVEGMEEEEEESEEGIEYDEHVWLSLKNAQILVNAIADSVAKIDAEHADAYKSNAEAYVKMLSELNAKYEEAANGAECKTVLFGDRFPFRYMFDDYGLEYYAAFAGCSAESEASFETITFLAKKVDELGLHSVMTIEGTDHSIAETIIQNTESKDQTVLEMNSMQSVTASDVKNGADYLAIMEKNLSSLEQALKG